MQIKAILFCFEGKSIKLAKSSHIYSQCRWANRRINILMPTGGNDGITFVPIDSIILFQRVYTKVRDINQNMCEDTHWRLFILVGSYDHWNHIFKDYSVASCSVKRAQQDFVTLQNSSFVQCLCAETKKPEWKPVEMGIVGMSKGRCMYSVISFFLFCVFSTCCLHHVLSYMDTKAAWGIQLRTQGPVGQQVCPLCMAQGQGWPVPATGICTSVFLSSGLWPGGVHNPLQSFHSALNISCILKSGLKDHG